MARDGIAARIAEVVENVRLPRPWPVEVQETDDERCAVVVAPGPNKRPLSLCVDAADRRFWILHTAAGRRDADWIARRLVDRGTRLGRTPFPSQMLARLTARGRCVGLGLDFDRGALRRVDASEGTDDDALKMQLRGARAWRVLELMGEDGSFAASTALSRMRIAIRAEGAGSGPATLDVRFDGGIATRGARFETHAALAGTLRQSYAKLVAKLEPADRSPTGGAAPTLTGRAVEVRPVRPIAEPRRFAQVVFSGARPFQLWGAPRATTPEFARVRAVDLATGVRLDFEIAPEFVRVHVPARRSGSAVMRFYSNMQRHHDARARLLDHERRDVFAL